MKIIIPEKADLLKVGGSMSVELRGAVVSTSSSDSNTDDSRVVSELNNAKEGHSGCSGSK